MFIAITFTIVKKKNRVETYSIEWIDKMLYIHTLDYYSAKQKAGGGLIIDTCYKIDETPKYYSKGKKSHCKRSHIA